MRPTACTRAGITPASCCCAVLTTSTLTQLLRCHGTCHKRYAIELIKPHSAVAAFLLPCAAAALQRVMPAMLQRALPKLGPPRRPKRLADQQRSRQRAVPTARQKMQLQGVVQRKALTLEKWQAAVQRQVGHEQQQQCCLMWEC